MRSAALQGMATGEVSFVVESPPERGEKAPRSTPLKLAISLEVIPTPPRWGLSHACRDGYCGIVTVCLGVAILCNGMLQPLLPSGAVLSLKQEGLSNVDDALRMM